MSEDYRRTYNNHNIIILRTYEVVGIRGDASNFRLVQRGHEYIYPTIFLIQKWLSMKTS